MTVMASKEELVDLLLSEISSLKEGTRYVLGLAGCPGAGKSMLSEQLVKGVNEKLERLGAIVVPMDGYHLSNEVLAKRNLLALKGIPETFDAEAFIALLGRLRRDVSVDVFAPLFDRSIEASIENAIVVKPEHKLCVVEGNYLLLAEEPWCQARQYFDEMWFVDAPFDVLVARLQARHEAAGRTAEDARRKVESTDLPNARLVHATKKFADRIV